MRSTRSLLSCPLVVLLMLGSSCNKHQPLSVGGIVDASKSDYFEMKRKCAKYIPEYKEQLEKEALEKYRFFKSGHSPFFISRGLEKMCYSKNKNTCVALVQEFNLKTLEGPIIGKTYFANDILTGELIDRASYGFYGRILASGDRLRETTAYKKEIERILIEVGCIE